MTSLIQPSALDRRVPVPSSPADLRDGAAARYPEDVAAPDVVKVLREDGTLDPVNDPRLAEAEVVHLYRAMLRTRLIDDRLTAIQRQGRIGFHIGSLGE